MTREELERRLESAEKQNLGLLDEIKWLKEKLGSRLEEAEKQNLGLLDEIQNLKAKLVEQGKQEIPDFPEFNCGDVVYELDDCFDVMEKKHDGGKGDKDFIRDDARFYNAFHTGDYAHELRRNCLMLAMMYHCKWYVDRNYVPDFTNSSEDKYFLFYDHVDGCFKYGLDCIIDNGSISFSTEEAAQKCADWMNSHWKDSGDE